MRVAPFRKLKVTSLCNTLLRVVNSIYMVFGMGFLREEL